MGTKDTTQKRLEDFEDIFADISNVLLYDGEDVIKENELETVTAKDTYTVEQQIHEVNARQLKGGGTTLCTSL